MEKELRISHQVAEVSKYKALFNGKKGTLPEIGNTHAEVRKLKLPHVIKPLHKLVITSLNKLLFNNA